MKQARLLLLMFIMAASVSFSSCKSAAITTTGSWLNKERKTPQQKYKSVFIVALTENREAKTVIENDLANAAKAKGFKTYTSLESFGPISGREGLPVKEAFLKKVADLNCETIFTISLIDQQAETRYVPGSSYSYEPYPRYGYYGMFGGYYNYASTSFYSPGYYSTDKKYFLESNLYDAKTEELLLSIQSKADNPPAIEKASKEYTESLIAEMESLGLLAK
jgi:hypothetical protein